MTDCDQQSFSFQDCGSKKVVADFSGGFLSSDGGALLLREIELRNNLVRRLSHCFTDYRDPRLIEHGLEELLMQRICGLALGYQDLNDHDSLRHDPLLALVCHKKDVLGLDRAEQNRGKALAGKSTLDRLELSAGGVGGIDKKTGADTEAITHLLIESGIQEIPRRSRRIVLDFDATDDPIHGQREGRFYHGYYRNYCYPPLHCFCGNIPLWAQLRGSDCDGAEGTVEALEKIVPAIRKRFGKKVEIVARGDGGFAREAIMARCERHHLKYCPGLSRNARLQRKLEPVFEGLEEQIDPEDFRAVRKYKDFKYKTRTSWTRPRRVVGKAELLEKGRNPRFIVTNFTAEEYGPKNLYEAFYCARGDMENRIKEQQLDLFADRTSSSHFRTNQMRLWFSAFAHLMMEGLRAETLARTSLAQATLGQIRLKLFKIAARVTVSCRRIHIQWCGASPHQKLLAQAHAALAS